MTHLTINAWLGFLITGVALGIGGVATYTNVRNSRGPLERRFVIWHCVAAWAAILLLLGLVTLTPFPWNLIWLALYFVHLPIAIYRFASKHQLIRVLEARDAAQADRAPREKKPAAP